VTHSEPGLEQAKLEQAKEEARVYAAGEERPLGSFLVLMGVYTGVVGGLFGAVRLSGRSLPQTPAWSDLALATVATHKVARLLSKDPVTSPLRAPFTRFAGTSGEAELAEEVRGSGPRKAIGELVTCPFCLGLWVATGIAFGLVLAPRPTRLVASIFTALTGADFLQFAYDKVQG
jgi:hypothetical protein